MSNSQQPHNWPEAARMLYTQMSEGSLHTNVRDLMAGAQCQRVLVACSGGADSIFMLCQLWAQAADLGVELVVAHYNHRWSKNYCQAIVIATTSTHRSAL